MTPTLSTHAALRRAVCIDPHDDTARLVLADALDETGGAMQAKWASLIRFQIALAQYGDGSDPAVARLIAGTDEPALLRELVPWLRRGERCGWCRRLGIKSPDQDDFVVVNCSHCHGPGWLGSLAARTARSMNARQLADAALNGGDNGYDWAIPATFTRGFVSRVELTVEQVLDAAFLARLFGEWPVTEAGLVGVHSADAIAAAGANIVSLGRAAAGLPQIEEVILRGT